MKKNSFLPGMCPHKMEQQCAHPPAIEAEVAAMENYYIKKLENAGFELHFVLFCAFILQESELRVYARKTKGGHFVDAYIRELNFTIGLDNAVNHARHFDTVRILAKTIYFQQELLHVEQGLVLNENYHHPQWAKEVTERFLAQIKENVKFQ